MASLIASLEDSVAGLVTFGSTVLGPDNVTPVQSYDWSAYHKAVDTNIQPVYPCLVATLDMKDQPGFIAEAIENSGFSDRFRLSHFLLFASVQEEPDYTVIAPLITHMMSNYRKAVAAYGFSWAYISHGPIHIKRIPAIVMPFKGKDFHTTWYTLDCEVAFS